MQTYDNWLSEAIKQLKAAGIDSAKLDAELILSHTIRQPRTYLHTHGDKELDARRHNIANARLELRLDHDRNRLYHWSQRILRSTLHHDTSHTHTTSRV